MSPSASAVGGGWLAAVMTMMIEGSALAAMPLEWQASAGCPSAHQVRGWVDALVDPHAQGSAEGEVVETAGGYRLALVVTTPQGRSERVLEAPECEALARAAAVVVAVAVDPVQAEARVDDARLAPMVVPPLAPPRAGSSVGEGFGGATGTAQPGSAAARRASWRPRMAVLGIEAGIGVGLLPQPHATLHAFGGLAWRRIEGQASATHRLGQLAEQPSGGGGVISVTTLGLAFGPALRQERWSLDLMAMLEAGVMVAAGRGVSSPRTAVSPWLGLGLRPGLVWRPVPWLGLRVDATLTGSLLRPQFDIEGGPLIHQTSLLGARVGMGVEFRAPLDQAGRGRRPRE